MRSDSSRRLIEVSLPLKAISAQSAREKSIRHGHISTLHIWWARRPLAAMRAAIFASLIPAPDSDEEREKLEQLIATIVDWDQVKNGNSEAVLKARQMVLDTFGGQPPRVLDPFMGGGATGLEALRLGCETHAVELNPVAHLIELCTLVYPQKYGQPEKRLVRQGAMEVEAEVNPLAEDVRKWGEWVLERAREEIGHLYEDPVNGETVVGYLWARTVQCPNPACGAEMPLVRGWWLAKRGKRKRVALKPIVDRKTKQVRLEVVQGDALKGFDPSKGTSSRGNATCLFCGQVADVDYIRKSGQDGQMWDTPLAVICEKAGLGKSYRPFAEQDGELVAEAVNLLTELDQHAPDELLPPIGTLGFRVQRYGLTSWSQLFNARQLLASVTFTLQVHAAYEAMLASGLRPEYAKSVATYLAIAADRIVDFSSSLTRWRTTVEAIAGTFGRQALPMVWDYVEINPTGATSGWSASIEWVTQVIEHTATISEQISTIHQGTSTRLPYHGSHFDAVVTDPPYYDAVPYADLSDFFYVWLKRSVSFLYPDLFRTPLTPKSAEIIQEPARHRDDTAAKAFYEQEMTRSFREARRVLHPEGIFVVVFAHKSTAAWETLINSLLEADLVVTASWPLHTERPGRLRAQESAALASSIFIVCRVRTAETDGYFDDVREELARTVRERLDFFWSQGIRGSDFFISAIGPAVSVFGKYKQVYRLDGTPVGVDTLLNLVQETVTDYALDRILNGHRQVGYVDPATRYYILHRWAYGANKIPFDDAMRMAMALGAEVDTLMDRRGILKQSGENVTLRGPKDRASVRDLGMPDRSGRQVSLIDVLHQAVLLWEKGDRAALAEFLNEAAFGREDRVRVVAQTLADVLPDDNQERRLLEGFLAGQEDLPGEVRQERLL